MSVRHGRDTGATCGCTDREGEVATVGHRESADRDATLAATAHLYIMASIALAEQLERLRDQADECRRHTIALDAKLRRLEGAHELGAMRERLHASSSRIDRAVGGLLELERQGLRPRLARPRR